MSPPPANNFDTLLSRIKSALHPANELTEAETLLASGREYPLVKIVLGKGNPRRILISAGIHGDEPAGVETVCAFLENELYKNFLKDWEFTILPCINPAGYDAGTRNNRTTSTLTASLKRSRCRAKWLS